jgi:hypothetical protein
MSNTKDYSKKIHQILNLVDMGKIYQALDSAKQVLSQEPNNPNLQSCCAGIFIDCGSALKDIESIKLGITLIEGILKKNEIQSSLDRVILDYNLSNGYAELASLYQHTGSNEAMLEAFQKKKQLLQGILLDKENLPDELLPNAIKIVKNLSGISDNTAGSTHYYKDTLSFPWEKDTGLTKWRFLTKIGQHIFGKYIKKKK